MSRYKKASHNEVELETIDGVTPILRPSRDEIFELITIFKEQQIDHKTDLNKIRDILVKTLYNSLFLWENEKRTNKKEEGSEDITKEDIDALVVDHVFEIWLDVLDKLKIIDKKKLEELVKEKAEEKESPN